MGVREGARAYRISAGHPDPEDTALDPGVALDRGRLTFLAQTGDTAAKAALADYTRQQQTKPEGEGEGEAEPLVGEC